MTKVAILAVPFIVTEHHLKIAKKFLSSIKSSFPIDTIAISNRNRGPSDDAWLNQNFNLVINNDQNILARAWNQGIRIAFERGATYVLVCNLDIELHPYCIDNLVEFAQENSQNIVWSPAFWNDPVTFNYAQLEARPAPDMNWSCFMVDKRFFQIMGKFDEGFIPAYQEDTDMAYRMKLANQTGASTYAALVLSAHRGTLQGLFRCSNEELAICSNLAVSIRKSITDNDLRYFKKWGGNKGKETFLLPFNGAGESL